MSNKIVFFGSPDFAVYSLLALYNSDFEVVGVVTQPAKAKGRNKIITDTPIAVCAKKLKLNLLSPTVFEENFIMTLQNLAADLFVVVAYGKILPPKLLALPRYGLINLHPSLLPKYRGPSPVQTAILNGDISTGLSIMKLDNKIDHGPILYQIIESVKTTDNNITLTDRLFRLGAEQLPTILQKYLKSDIKLTIQDDKAATYTKMLSKEDGLIDWTKEAKYIRQQILAYQPWPGAYSYCQNKLYKFLEVDISKEKLLPGQININKTNQQLLVGTGDWALEIKTLQMAGKSIQSAKNFISGNNLQGLFFTTNPKS